MRDTITNSEDVLDSRDIITRIEELQAERDEQPDRWAEENPDDAEELASLEKLAAQAEPYAADWEYGETLIRDSYFVDYIEELIRDCYEMPKEMTSGNWPYRHISIDYKAAAEEAKQDYTAVDFDGVTYWVR
jgi:hypothetical protein